MTFPPCFKRFCLLMLWLFPLGTVAGDCVRGFSQVKLTLLEEPILVGEEQICAGAERSSEFRNIRFLETDPPRDLGENVQVYAEIISRSRERYHILRASRYYGEFIDSTFTPEKGHLKDLTLLLTYIPNAQPNTLRALQYLQGTEDYIWKDRRVVQVKRQQQLVSLKNDLSTFPLGPELRSLIERRVFSVDLKFPNEGDFPLQIQTSFYDPALQRNVRFRTFSFLGKPQMTILPFVHDDQGKAHEAFVEIVAKGRVYRKLKVEDPGRDGSEVLLQMQ